MASDEFERLRPRQSLLLAVQIGAPDADSMLAALRKVVEHLERHRETHVDFPHVASPASALVLLSHDPKQTHENYVRQVAKWLGQRQYAAPLKRRPRPWRPSR